MPVQNSPPPLRAFLRRVTQPSDYAKSPDGAQTGTKLLVFLAGGFKSAEYRGQIGAENIGEISALLHEHSR